MNFLKKLANMAKDALEFYVENEDEIKEVVRKSKSVAKKIKDKKNKKKQPKESA